uniref:Uncharacterized protein n=1 Tax=Cucumis melo TaxID=3656 RepID=A0A9I9EJ65_CUCME
MIRVIRRDRSQPDYLSVSSGYTTDQFVLGVPLGSPKTRFVPTGSQIARVWKCANSWVLLYRTLMGSEGKGREKLASDTEGSVTCHMGTQFCFRVYVSVFQYSVFNEKLVFPRFKKVSIIYLHLNHERIYRGGWNGAIV